MQAKEVLLDDGTYAPAVVSVNQDGSVNSSGGGINPPIDYSGSLTLADHSQEVAPANANGYRFEFQNISSGDLWIRTGGGAWNTESSIPLSPRQMYTSPSWKIETGALTVWGLTTGQKFTCTVTSL